MRHIWTRAIFIILLVFLAGHARAQVERTPTSWVMPKRSQMVSFFVTDSAANVAERMLAYQKDNGGWPANVNYGEYLGKMALKSLSQKKGDLSSCSIVNGSTLNEIRYLSAMYNATGRKKYKKAAEDGLEYLLSLQYGGGGWPSGGDGSSTVLTFSNSSFILVMETLISISQHKALYGYLDDKVRSRAASALQRSVDCILMCQVIQDGKFTIWSSTYDSSTFQPIAPSASIPASLSPRESAAILYLLMSMTNPSDRIISTIDGAVAWYRENAIHGLSRENFVTKTGKRDYKYKEDKHAPDLWASYYDIRDNSPIYTEADGERVADVKNLSIERRNAMSWLINDGVSLFRRYEKWKKTVKGQ